VLTEGTCLTKKRQNPTGVMRVHLTAQLHYARRAHESGSDDAYLCGPSVVIEVNGKIAWKNGVTKHSTFAKTGDITGDALIDLEDGQHTAQVKVFAFNCHKSGAELDISDVAIEIYKVRDVPSVVLRGALLKSDTDSSSSSSSSSK
jgi:hypothetical protein